jgi:hypothetical protein
MFPMTGTPRAFKVRRLTSWTELSVLAFSGIALISISQAAVAAPIIYTLENAEAGFTAATENYTGTISLDQDYQVTSASISEFGTVDATLTYVTTFVNSIISLNNGNDNILIAFKNTFSNPKNTIDPIFSIADMNLGKASDVTGAAYPPTPTPEPSSLALLAGAAGLFLLTRRASRHRWRAQSGSHRTGVKPGANQASPPLAQADHRLT